MRPRIHTRGPTINLVERWFALLSERKIKRASHRSTRELERGTRALLRHAREHPRPFIETKSADQILASIHDFCRYPLDTQRKGLENFGLKSD